MKTINIYLYEQLVKKEMLVTDWEKSPIFTTIEIDDEDDIWGMPILIGEDFYTPCVSFGNNCAVRKLEHYKHDEDEDELEEFGEENIKCPVCGAVEVDSWEYDYDEDEEFECPDCGSILSWQREVTVTYNTQVVKVNKFNKA